ncbi:uncharacterized protein LOC142615274 [Castanea sativa]|uniref:uncharacterized protein LOC142615274 n=1 Tax=Castanea sativa TaxID=21020 RepID=UPI003F64ADF0
MAYIPPHKRHSYEAASSSESSDTHNRPSTIPQSLVPQFRRNLNLRLPPKTFSQRCGNIVYNYAKQAMSAWFPVGLDHNHQFPSSVHVTPVPLQLFGRTAGTNPLVLFNNNNNHPVEQVRSPWVYIAENVVSDLLSSFENVKDEKLDLEDVKPKLVARFGKILFHESPSISEETTRVGLAAETTLSQLRRSFYTNIPNSYMENIKGEVAKKIKVDFEEEKDLYHVQDDEMQSIRSLINSAILDQDVKGGLRWPLGKASSGGRYCVVGVWHTIAKDYKSSSLSLKVRHADRYDFRTSIGEATREINLKLKNIVSLLQEQEVEVSSVAEMLKDHLKLIWDHFLCCENFLT